MARWSAILILFVLVLPMAFANDTAFGAIEDAIETLGIGELPEIYKNSPNTSIAIDFILVLVFFITLTMGMKDRIKIGEKPLIVLGVILAIGFSMFELQSGFRLGDFAVLAQIVLILVIAMFIHQLLKKHTGVETGFELSLFIFLTALFVTTQMIEFDLFDYEALSGFRGLLILAWVFSGLFSLIRIVGWFKHGMSGSSGGGGGSFGKNAASLAKGVGNIGLGAGGFALKGVKGVAGKYNEKRENNAQETRDHIEALKVTKEEKNLMSRIDAADATEFKNINNLDQLGQYLTQIISGYRGLMVRAVRLRNIYNNLRVVRGKRLSYTDRNKLNVDFETARTEYLDSSNKISSAINNIIGGGGSTGHLETYINNYANKRNIKLNEAATADLQKKLEEAIKSLGKKTEKSEADNKLIAKLKRQRDYVKSVKDFEGQIEQLRGKISNELNVVLKDFIQYHKSVENFKGKFVPSENDKRTKLMDNAQKAVNRLGPHTKLLKEELLKMHQVVQTIEKLT